MTAPSSPADRRKRLLRAGYMPVPVVTKDKRPPLDSWQHKTETNDAEIDLWSAMFPQARSTGLLTIKLPTLDLDIMEEPAVEAAEALVRERFEERGRILVRFGRAPKRAIPFRTNDPFKKILVILTAENGREAKIELLATGQQVVAFGLHGGTGKPYHWFRGDEPGDIRRDELPSIDEAEARQLVKDIADLLCRDFGYQRAKSRPKTKSQTNGGNDAGSGPADWGYLVENIRAGRALHDSLRDLAGKLVFAGTEAGAVVNFLYGLMDETPEGYRDQRWKERRAEIPRLVDGASACKEEQKPGKGFPPSTIGKTLEVFERWLLLGDTTPIYAVLGTVAANLLPGDPVWLGLVGPPSSAKTEVLNSLSLLPDVVQAATLTPASLLSGTPKKNFDKTAKGGLLRQIGDFGIMVLKDFGSILSMRPDMKAEALAALREIYDGHWTRHLGTDGGKTLSWKGKVGLIFSVRPASLTAITASTLPWATVFY